MSQNHFSLELNTAFSGDAHVEIFDAGAHRMYYGKIGIRQGMNLLTVHLHTLPVGTYFVTVVNSDKMISYGKFSKTQ